MARPPLFHVRLTVAPTDPRVGRVVRLPGARLVTLAAPAPRRPRSSRRPPTDQRHYVGELRKLAGLLRDELQFLNESARVWSCCLLRDRGPDGERLTDLLMRWADRVAYPRRVECAVYAAGAIDALLAWTAPDRREPVPHPEVTAQRLMLARITAESGLDAILEGCDQADRRRELRRTAGWPE